ncbi:protein NO VEIN domain-containing protein [Paraburkholderia aspalathi]|uniref:protein NO VEIN domain-containing protein n=1 Tax=Paraburkholderia aspalathi TaxID=1324617 RepID=UPI001BA5EEB9|nr:DUF3883 domain-containing protein [Paraburkholderia aspalathi]
MIDLIQTLGWLRVNDSGVAVVAPTGDRILRLGNDRKRLRRALLDYVEVFRPPWLMMTLDGRLRTLTFAPIEFRQSMVEAYLAEGCDDEVIEFWDRLAAIARGQQDIKLSAVGREGERLTIAYEKQRTGVAPVWRSIESNADGYDVMSIVSDVDHAQLQIEVKASSIGLSGILHLTRNEWDATESMPHHTFHLWDLSNQLAPRLATVPRVLMEAHIPTDRGTGRWGEAEIPFNVFVGYFVTPSGLKLHQVNLLSVFPESDRAGAPSNNR